MTSTHHFSLPGLVLPLALACSPNPTPVAQPASDAPRARSPVQVDAGLLSGVPGTNPAVSVFRGIPFAAPPAGERRWRPPEPPLPWQGVRSAAEFSPHCPQRLQRSLGPWTEEYMPQRAVGEDCLALNVWTAATSAAERRPVFVYIHGGGYTGGSGDVSIYDGEALAARGVVVVTFNYRLGVFGFFAHPELTRESPQHASGNYGLLDQLAALRWVQRNIAAFGGDPTNVTVGGQSAGAGSVHLLTASPLARGLFHRAIAQSGPWDQRQTIPDLAVSEARGGELAGRFGGAGLPELRALPSEALLQEAVQSGIPFRPSVDGYVVPDQVQNVYRRGEQIDVPLLTGLTADEDSSREDYGTLDAAGLEKLIHERFPAQAAELSPLYVAGVDSDASERHKQFLRDAGLAKLRGWRDTRAQRGSAPDYAYYFERAIPWPEQPRYQAFHSGELPYMFDNLRVLHRPWEETDRALAELMASYWVSFIQQGNPNAAGRPEWPSERERVMRLGARPGPDALPRAEVAPIFARAFEVQP